MDELISIIVPVYNVEKYLQECVDSIIKQTYQNLEIILVDDGSKDSSGKLCDEYAKKDSRIKVIHKENGGVSSARNIGLDEATGQWISFVDSDDWINENFCALLYESAIEKNADIVQSGYNRIVGTQKEPINADGNCYEYNSRDYLIKTLNPQTGFGFCHMKIYKKDIIKDVRFKEGLKVGEDALFGEQISKNINKAIVLQKALYNYRINNNSVVRKFDENYADKYLKSMIITKEYLGQEYKNDNEIWQNYYNFVAYHILLIAVNYCYNPENKTKNKKKILKDICKVDEFKEGISKSNFNNLSLTRKVTLFTLKCKFYFFTSLICKYRQYQTNGGGKNN